LLNGKGALRSRTPGNHLSLENAQELIESFHEENPDMASGAAVEYERKVILVWTSKRMRFFTLLPGVQKGFHLFGKIEGRS